MITGPAPRHAHFTLPAVADFLWSLLCGRHSGRKLSISSTFPRIADLGYYLHVYLQFYCTGKHFGYDVNVVQTFFLHLFLYIIQTN